MQSVNKTCQRFKNFGRLAIRKLISALKYEHKLILELTQSLLLPTQTNKNFVRPARVWFTRVRQKCGRAYSWVDTKSDDLKILVRESAVLTFGWTHK